MLCLLTAPRLREANRTCDMYPTVFRFKLKVSPRTRSSPRSMSVDVSCLALADVHVCGASRGERHESRRVTDRSQRAESERHAHSHTNSLRLDRTSEIKFWNNSSDILCEEGSPPAAAILPLVYMWRSGVTWARSSFKCKSLFYFFYFICIKLSVRVVYTKKEKGKKSSINNFRI